MEGALVGGKSGKNLAKMTFPRNASKWLQMLPKKMSKTNGQKNALKTKLIRQIEFLQKIYFCD